MKTLRSTIDRYGLHIWGVLQIGAHYGKEYALFQSYGVENMIFFEPVKSTFKTLVENIPVNGAIKAFNVALGNTVGQMEMYTETNNKGMSNSLLRPKLHLKAHPRIVFTGREMVNVDKLDNIEYDRTKYNMILIDVQGYELEVFRGAVQSLPYVDYIYSEINTAEVYENCAQVDQLDAFLMDFGFFRIFTKMTVASWGDALYKKYG